jgi:hypothetical protein
MLLIVFVLSFIPACDRHQEAAGNQPPSATQSTPEKPRSGTLDAIFAEIVRTDWQTTGQWDRRSQKPPLDFIVKVREKAEFRHVDLDRDGIDEQIICLNYSPGQKPINQTFYVIRKVDNGWGVVGHVEGEPVMTSDPPTSGMQPLDATWYNGGFEYTTTRYEFVDGRYVARKSKRWRPN